MKKVIVIAGVTGSGKTKLGIELANKLNGEIISADSVAIYKDLHIGSAKPNVFEQSQATHHLIDFLDVSENYSVAQFQKDARDYIDDITSRGKIPIIVGGTGLYINALINDYEFLEESNDKQIDDSLSDEELYDLLTKVDPELASSIHPNNRKRLIRALIRKNHNNKGNLPVYDALVFFLQSDRDTIYERINKRVDLMFSNGLLDEVSGLYENHERFFEYQSTQSIGYREFRDYFKGDMSLDEVSELIKRNTRRFAKRQITWFKNKTNSIWIDLENTQEVYKHIDKWLVKEA